MKLTPFFSRIGLELTWVLYRPTSEYDWIEGYVRLLRARFKENKFRYFRIYNDSEALEVATPSFSNMNQIKEYYFDLLTELSILPLVTHRKDCTSGGGHIHVELPRDLLGDRQHTWTFLVTLFRDLRNRPYLNWILNEWGSNESAQSLAKFTETSMAGEQARWMTAAKYLPLLLNSDQCLIPDIMIKEPMTKWFDVFDPGKGYEVRISGPERFDGTRRKPATIEFRFLDAKRNFKDISLHVEFINRYVSWIYKRCKNTKVSPLVRTTKDVLSLAKSDRCILEFKKLLDELGLNYGDYEDYVEYNYRKRKRIGRLV